MFLHRLNRFAEFHKRGGLELIFFGFGVGVLSKFLLDNSSFSALLLIIIAQSLNKCYNR